MLIKESCDVRHTCVSPTTAASGSDKLSGLWNAPVRFTSASSPVAASTSLSSSTFTLAADFFFRDGVPEDFAGWRFLVALPRVGRALLSSSACRRAA